jgi:hypothetical protein
MKTKTITLGRVRELLSYDPETGIFTWIGRTSNRITVGDRAGRDTGNGYRRIAIDGYSYYEHHLAWFLVYGEWPENEIDHIDGKGFSNRIANLRKATPAQNRQNAVLRRTNKSGRTGVSWAKNIGKWEAYIWVNYKKKPLGYFDDLQDAGAAYLAAKRELHSFQPTPRGVA